MRILVIFSGQIAPQTDRCKSDGERIAVIEDGDQCQPEDLCVLDS